MNFTKLYIGDYQRDTGTLTLAQHGAYLLMLLQYYATEKPIPEGRELHRLLRAETKLERDAIDFVSAKFWIRVDGGLANARGLKEIEKASHQKVINQQIGKLGGRPRKTDSVSESVIGSVSESETESVSESKPNRNPNQTPDTSTYINPNGFIPVAGSPQSAAPPKPPLPFDGHNAEILNGKAVVELASGWELPEPWGLDAESLGFKPGEVLREAEKFRQYFVSGRGSGTRRSVKGWRQSWSNWLGKAEARR